MICFHQLHQTSPNKNNLFFKIKKFKLKTSGFIIKSTLTSTATQENLLLKSKTHDKI